MKLCIVGIGGAGGRVAKIFLENVDLNNKILSHFSRAEYVSAGKVEGIWLESASTETNQPFFKDLNKDGYPCFFIPQARIPDGCALQKDVTNKYGYTLNFQGTVRDAQYLKAIFEIFNTDKDIQDEAYRALRSRNPIFDSAWESIRTYTILDEPKGPCEGILFVVSLGGGTGTGFINPIIDHIIEGGRTDFPIFVLGIFTEPGDHFSGGQFSKEGKRYLSAISALYDLLTKPSGAHGIILMDNEILEKRAGSNIDSQNRFIYKVMKPMILDRAYPGKGEVSEDMDGQAGQRFSSGGLNFPPLFVPLYWSQPRQDNPEETLVSQAFSKGKLFDCSPDKADRAIVFCRGFIDTEKIRDALKKTGRLSAAELWVTRKIGEREDEILILLRNPYGKDKNAYDRPGALENKFCKVIESSLKYINENEVDLFYRGEKKEGEDVPAKLTNFAEKSVGEYFFGQRYPNRENYGKTDGLVYELKETLRRLEAGKGNGEAKPFDPSEDDPLFRKELRIFEKVGIISVPKDTKSLEIDKSIEQQIKKIVDKRLEELGITI